MVAAIVPPYLLARLAAAPPERFAHAAHAARATLAVVREYRPGRTRLRLSIDADGALVAETAPGPDRAISDAENSERLPGRLVRREDDPATSDTVVDEAFDGLGATYDLLWDAFARDGLSGLGGELPATVHYGVDYDNAFWNGERMVFGDGDGEVFSGFTRSLSVIAHELAHGVIDAEGGLDYRGQSGALNESFADVIGALAEQHLRGQTAAEASWLIGEGIFTAAVQGRALRSLAAPGTAYDDDVLGRDPQPAHMRDFVVTDDDNGGVHINSGIPNRAFHLVALTLGGFAWERAGRIWYRTLAARELPTDADFRTFAAATVRTAVREYGGQSEEARAVRAAWAEVGVDSDERPVP
ncbi:M4 family metallopeptidase [Microbacterium aurantiacum]|uniref:Neutral metalloproteinase n=1 Tax=Microbacterium aurantiacum TaxID=162393 RepID=A0A0M8MPA0_9MICO|nr:M4 family metallopeptidase [Microbacterium chocolatum]ANG85297.1 peptidase M4 [Microbacterium chocolatum]KOS11080.1 peptidase M4 [Microbacterium chocolatum]